MNNKMMKMALLSVMTLSATSVFAQQKPVACVWDLLGSSGEVAQFMKSYAIEAAKWGAQLELKTYTDDKVASEDFKAGKCDLTVINGIRAREYNKFTGTIDSVGAIRTLGEMEQLIATLAGAGAAKKMQSGQYEIAGIAPIGTTYLYVKNKAWNKVADMAGKKLGILPFDKAQRIMAEKVGSDGREFEIMRQGVAFNNGAIDIVGLPAAAYKPMELYKGLGTQGGIAQYAVLNPTVQAIIRSAKFPAGFGQKSREFFASNFKRFKSSIEKFEKEVPASTWIPIPAADAAKYDELLRVSRVEIAKQGIYDPDMLKVMKRLRCKSNPSHAECADKLES